MSNGLKPMGSLVTRIFTFPMREGHGKFMGLITTVLVAMLAASSLAHSNDIPHYAVKVAGRLNGHMSWGIWLYGKRHRQDCWDTRTRSHREVTSESVTCGVAVTKAAYQLAASGPVGTANAPQGLLFFFVKPGVRRLALLIENRKGKRSWTSVASRSISSEERRSARLSHRFGYVVKVIRRTGICAVRVRAIGPRGKLIGHGRLKVCV